jgi:hypothetical protein
VQRRSAGRLASAVADAGDLARDPRLIDDDADILTAIRQRLAERGEPADDMTDDGLRAALRVTLRALAQEFAPDGARTGRRCPRGRSGYPPEGRPAHVVGPPPKGPALAPRCRLDRHDG